MAESTWHDNIGFLAPKYELTDHKESAKKAFTGGIAGKNVKGGWTYH